jgi:quercetin dioxygenase-like cupin family protein
MPTARSDDRSDDFRPATAYPLGELAAVAPGAIVSRTLVRSGGGTVTLFAFDEGQSLSEHTTPFDALVLELTIGGEAVHAAAGQIVLMPANVPHGLAAVRPSRMLLVMLRDRGAGA